MGSGLAFVQMVGCQKGCATGPEREVGLVLILLLSLVLTPTLTLTLTVTLSVHAVRTSALSERREGEVSRCDQLICGVKLFFFSQDEVQIVDNWLIEPRVWRSFPFHPL